MYRCDLIDPNGSRSMILVARIPTMGEHVSADGMSVHRVDHVILRDVDRSQRHATLHVSPAAEHRV